MIKGCKNGYIWWTARLCYGYGGFPSGWRDWPGCICKLSTSQRRNGTPWYALFITFIWMFNLNCTLCAAIFLAEILWDNDATVIESCDDYNYLKFLLVWVRNLEYILIQLGIKWPISYGCTLIMGMSGNNDGTVYCLSYMYTASPIFQGSFRGYFFLRLRYYWKVIAPE